MILCVRGKMILAVIFGLLGSILILINETDESFLTIMNTQKKTKSEEDATENAEWSVGKYCQKL